jgi:Fe-S-cluster containining protein
MNINFECTLCGKCCHNLKVPLTVTEAMDWLTDGNDVQILCEAAPWPIEPSADDRHAAHKKRRSFAAMSGSLPTRVTVILAAMFSGACPNLQADMRCGIYQRRPLVCRIYPAEINPFVELLTANKACPPEAWTADRPPLLQDGMLVDAQTQALIQQSRDTDAGDVHTKEILCASLQIDATALANEGFVVYSPGRTVLLEKLRQAVKEPDRLVPPAAWRYISNRRSTLDILASIGAVGSLAGEKDERGFEYLGFHPAAA